MTDFQRILVIGAAAAITTWVIGLMQGFWLGYRLAGAP